LPISLVEKYRSHTGAELDNTEDETEVRFQGKIGVVLVSDYRPLDGSFFEEIEHSFWRKDQGVGGID
jgi:hypothetical protein